MKKSRRMYKSVMLLGGVLLVLLISFAVYGIYVYSYNHTERVMQAEDCKEQDVSKDCHVLIEPRGGDADSWEKEVKQESGETIVYEGLIYHGVITNYTTSQLQDWSLRVNIQQDCYINNAWCGELEIHQQTPEGEKVQTLDLRSYDESEVTLNHSFIEQDMMIELHKGDYFIYHPSAKDRELPIGAADLAKEEYRSVDIGVIFYYLGDTSLQFDDYTMNYRLTRVIAKDIVFRILLFLSIIWLILCILAVVIHYNMRVAKRRLAQYALIIEQSLSVFSKVFEEKDEYTVGHSERVALYTRRIAEEMGFSKEECVQMYYIALMHDCGKYFIPDEILKKPGRLTDEEFALIRLHTIKGAELLEDFGSLEGIRDGALYHHERYDGHGYPTGKAGEEIPLIGRIICVADSFDAMNSKRCYRDRLTEEHIISELKENRGKQFDPKIIDVFMRIVPDILAQNASEDRLKG